MANAINVLCNEDYFMHIQSFNHGYERYLIDFSARYNPKLSIGRLLEEALAVNQWKIVEKLYEISFLFYNDYFLSRWKKGYFATEYPHYAYSLLSTCEWLHTKMGNTFLYWKEYMSVAAAVGNLNLVMFMHANRPEGCTTYAMDYAAANGHLEIVEFLHGNRTEGCTTKAMDLAAMNGYLDVVKFLHENRMEGCSTKAMDNAAANGHMDILIFLHENRTEGCTIDAIVNAGCNGHKEIVVFLQEHRLRIYANR